MSSMIFLARVFSYMTKINPSLDFVVFIKSALYFNTFPKG